MAYEGKWEKRWHPLRREWVTYAAHRNSRPWTTSKVKIERPEAPAYDPTCYLCPTNQRVSGNFNPDYKGVYIFENDHPVVGFHAPEVAPSEGFYKKESAKGIAKVICYDPRHHVTLSEVGVDKVEAVFAAWASETESIQKNPSIKSIFIFENKGEVCGVSNPHPHCQLYATDFVFKAIEEEIKAAQEYYLETGKNIFQSIIEAEVAEGTRIIAENEFGVAFLPFFARYAYEVMLFPKRKVGLMSELSPDELNGLAAIYHEVIRRYDALFGFVFPYVMGIMQAPVNVEIAGIEQYHLHFSFLPPTRQPGLTKILGGPEAVANSFMADTLPEEKATELKAINLNEYPIPYP